MWRIIILILIVSCVKPTPTLEKGIYRAEIYHLDGTCESLVFEQTTNIPPQKDARGRLIVYYPGEVMDIGVYVSENVEYFNLTKLP